nr:ATP-binding protein [Clostridium algidicarnis]
MQKVKANTQVSSHSNQKSQKNLTQQTLYKCDLCKDTGYLIEQPQESQPVMKRCKCQDIEIASRQWKSAGINPLTNKQTFSNFEAWNESSKSAKNTTIAYYKRYEDIKSTRKNSIMLCGQVGSGKTHLSIALALNFIQKGIRVVYMPFRDVITSLKQNMLDEEFYKRQVSKFQTADILLLDDLFKGKINETDINIMFEIINYRYLNYLPMIVSTEFTLDKMLNFDEAVGSRIYEMCKDYTIEIRGQGNNYRLK